MQVTTYAKRRRNSFASYWLSDNRGTGETSIRAVASQSSLNIGSSRAVTLIFAVTISISGLRLNVLADSRIQRIRGGEGPKQVTFDSLSVSFKNYFGTRQAEQIDIKSNGDCVYHIDELPAQGTNPKRTEADVENRSPKNAGIGATAR